MPPKAPERYTPETTMHETKGWKALTMIVVIVVLLSVAALSVAYTLNKPPANQTLPTSFTVEPGMGVKTITTGLESASVIRSKTFLYLILSLFHNARDIKASTYVFDKPQTSFAVAAKLVSGEFDNDLIKFTHVEGESTSDIAERAARDLPSFDKAAFIARAKPLEGMLYPETYYIPKTFTADELIALMEKTFNEKTADLNTRMASSSLGTKGVLVLASILEREANSPESMRMVSDILQRRMKEGMPLQTDASIEYILRKPLKELTPDDLKIDSPYNTYKNRGLPPTPIGNPGREAILAVLEPTPNHFVYYITDNDGVFHYAKTLDEHNANVAKYLR